VKLRKSEWPARILRSTGNSPLHFLSTRSRANHGDLYEKVAIVFHHIDHLRGCPALFSSRFLLVRRGFRGRFQHIADMNQPMLHAVWPAVDEGWVDMESYKGKVVLISFWTTWCPACRDEMPELIKLQKLGSKGFTVVAVSVDDQGEESIETFVQTEHFPVDGSSATINFPVLLGNEEIAQIRL
jgi:thiol-disulfide isomerase/thioredoxin